MRTRVCLAFVLVSAVCAGMASAGDVKKSYTSDDVVKFMMAQKALVQGRSVCIGSESECAASQPKTSGFDMVINFDINSANLRPESKRNLLQVAAALRSAALNRDSFRIEGFTDALGTEKYNIKLSEDRARAVEQFLADNDIKTSRMTAVGLGENSPRDKDPYSSKNRRVELKLKVN